MNPGASVFALGGCSTFLFGITSLAALRRLSDEKIGYTRFLLAAGGAGIILNVILLAVRTAHTDAPAAISSSFDMMILISSLLVVAALAALAVKKLRGLEGMLIPIACVTQVVAWFKISPPPSEAAYEPWFIVHMASLALGVTCFVLTGVAGMAYLALTRVLRKKSPSPLFGKFAPLETLESFGRWTLLVGWPVFTFGILAGICEVAQSAQPTRWLTDPLIVFTFVMWFIYAFLLASSWLRPSFRGRRSARWAAGALGLLAFVVLIVGFLSPVHP